MKFLILILLFPLSALATNVVCFEGKVGMEKVDKVCFDKTTLDPSATKVISTNEVGISTIEVMVFGTTQALTLFSTQSNFNKKTAQE